MALTNFGHVEEAGQNHAGRSSPNGSPKWLVRGLWLVLILAMAGVVIAKLMQPHRDPLPVLFQPDPFALIDQDNKPFSSDMLKGSPYVCDFVFTTCGMVCPIMSKKLALVQKQTARGVQLVSFTVDPVHDTPGVLKGYASLYGADPSRWHFLTGSPEQMSATVSNMKLGFQAATERNPIIHSEKFLLVDQVGRVRGVYDSGDEQAMKNLAADANRLADQ